jgi:hypothetical protein
MLGLDGVSGIQPLALINRPCLPHVAALLLLLRLLLLLTAAIAAWVLR